MEISRRSTNRLYFDAFDVLFLPFFSSLSLSLAFKVVDDMDQDECDETIGSDIDDRASETDSKKDGSRGTSRGSSNEGKSQGNSSKPRRYVNAKSISFHPNLFIDRYSSHHTERARHSHTNNSYR